MPTNTPEIISSGSNAVNSSLRSLADAGLGVGSFFVVAAIVFVLFLFLWNFLKDQKVTSTAMTQIASNISQLSLEMRDLKNTLQNIQTLITINNSRGKKDE